MSTLEIDVTVEIPYGSNLKYEIDENGDIRLDRVLSCSMSYPGNYGFIEKESIFNYIIPPYPYKYKYINHTLR